MVLNPNGSPSFSPPLAQLKALGQFVFLRWRVLLPAWPDHHRDRSNLIRPRSAGSALHSAQLCDMRSVRGVLQGRFAVAVRIS